MPSPANLSEAADAVLAQGADVQDTVRRLAEQGLEQTRVAYARFKSAAEEATGQIEATYAVATSGLREFNSAAIDALKTNTDAHFEFVKAMLGVRDLSDAVRLQAEHVRRQVEALNGQAKDLGAMAQRLASSGAETIKTQLGKGFGPGA